MKRMIFVILCCLISFATYGVEERLYVSSTGDDGSFLTIEDAVNHAESILDNVDVEIIIKEGTYVIKNTILLPSTDGVHSLTITGNNATLFGGSEINHSWFKPLENGEFADRLVDQSGRTKIVVCDLYANGIRDLGEITTQGWSKDNPNRIPPAILTIGSERMTLARWPNVGEKSPHIQYKHYQKEPKPLVGYEQIVQEIIDKVSLDGEVGVVSYVDPGDGLKGGDGCDLRGGTYEVSFDRMKHWGDVKNIFVDGIFNSTWEWSFNRIANVDTQERHITLQDPELYPLGTGESVRLPHMHYTNIPEEIDLPGEYYIDRANGLLYLYPPENFQNETIVLAILAKPIFSGVGCNRVVIRDIKFDTGRNLAIDLTQANNCVVESCTISGFVAGGIRMDGSNNIIDRCHIYGIGGYGVSISGGDSTNLIAGNNIVSNCEINDFGWDQKSQMPGVLVDGVGHIVKHCDIYDGTHFGIRLRNTNDIVVEYNKIHDLPTYHFFDGGALYIHSGCDPLKRGNVIRYNHLHDIPTIGVYPDNYTWGVEIYGNLFERVGVLANRAAIMMNGGGESHSYNNIMIDCPLIYNQGRHPSSLRAKVQWQSVMEMYGNGRIENIAHKKYDDLKGWLDDDHLQKWLNNDGDAEPNRAYQAKSYLYNNILYNPNVEIYKRGGKQAVIDSSERLEMDNNWVFESDPGFVDFQNGNYNLRSDSDVFTKIKEFEPIPIDKIGIDSTVKK